MAKLVIIRGNSGSGKSSLARKLQTHYGQGTLLIAQDTVRRDMLKEKVELGNLSIDLSFIGWNLLAKMTYGILNIMVLPYTAIAYILFYEELKKEKAILNENNPQA